MELHGAEDEIEAGHAALRSGDWGRAMYAARLAVARRGIEGEVLTEEILAHPDVCTLLREIRRRPWRRAELLLATMRPSAIPRPLEENRGTTCHRDGKEIGPDEGATFYDGLAYCDECLNAAGGEGFADAVRREPVLVRRVPNGVVMTGFLLCLMGGAAWWAWSQALDAGVRAREAGVVTGGLVALGFGYVSFSGRRRRARIEGTSLLVEGSGALMLDQILEVRRTWWLIHSPIYRALGGATEMVQWPRHGPGSEAIARALLAAIELRPRAPLAGGRLDYCRPQ